MEQRGGIIQQFYDLTVSSVNGLGGVFKTFDYLAFMWGKIPQILQRARALREPRAPTFEAGKASAHKLDG